MKFNVILCLCLSFISQLIIAQPCNSFNVSLINQADVEGFLIQNGDCTEITGDLVIGNNVENLDGLENIKKIGGYFSMSNCDALTDIKGLKNLTEVGSWMRMQHNPMLQSYEGLNSLQKVRGDFFYISDSDRIKDLSPLSNLDSINGIFQIWDMDSLQNFSGLNGLKHVGADLSIFRNKLLTTISGLDSLTAVNGGMRIYENEVLNSILDFNSLLRINSQITIYDNSSLSECNAVALCEKLFSLPDAVIISNNDSGCSSKEEVIEICLTYSKNTEDSKLKIFPNPFHDFIIIESNNTSQNVKIIDVYGKEIRDVKVNETIDLSFLSAGIYFFCEEDRVVRIVKI